MLWLIPAAAALYGGMRAKKQGGSFGRGAVTGGLLGAGAAYAAPALAGAMGGTGAAAAGTASAAPMATAGAAGSSGGLLSSGMTALSAANQAQGLLGGNQQVPQMAPQQITAPQGLMQFNEQSQQGINALMDETQKRRMQNQQIINQMMGRNYG